VWSDISHQSTTAGVEETKNMHYARVSTLVKPRVLLRGFLFVLRALIYFAIFAELVLLVYVLEAIA
jgi:hypothetical protein